MHQEKRAECGFVCVCMAHDAGVDNKRVTLTTNLAACVSVQNLTNFCPAALISTPNVPKILFA